MSQQEIEKFELSRSPGLDLDGSNIYGPVVTQDSNLTIHERFSEKAGKFPKTLAVISDHEKYTYEEVEKLSNALACKISALTDGKSSFVGISMERSARVVIGLLSILKAGCAYVPLDPSYPKDRLNDMLADTKAPIVITTSNLKPIFEDHGVVTLCVDDCLELTHEEPPPRKEYYPESLAYVIFTSGSTGRPKGVCCFHKSVLNLLSDFQNRQSIGHGDVCSWWTSLNFDVSVYEIFSPLIEGATLIVAPESVRSSGPDLMAWIYENNVTSAYLPPFMVSDLDSWATRNSGKGTLRRLLVGVEPIPERTLLAIDEAMPSVHIINGYGPTETTICSTLYSVSPANATHENTPIGKPVQNTVLRIMDEEGNLTPRGSVGELFIGGVGLAEGYLNRPDLSQARFVRDHFSQDSGARLYRTGDLVRLHEDGNLEFLGRRDFQVKIRGFRVELGEIETLLRGLEPIRESVVLLREDDPGRQNLVAYFVFREGQSISIRSIRDHLKEYLPDYMIPAAFVEIATIPYTPNGKTDRAVLPVPTAEHVIHSDDNENQEPESSLESTLLGYFSELLKIKKAGVHDNFFELGGHSLLATQLVSRIRDEFGATLSLSDIFRAPTVRQLSQTIVSMKPEQSESAHLSLKHTDSLSEYPMSCSQMRIWYLDQLEPNTPAYNICVAYELRGPINLVALNESVNLITSRHQSLRTTFEKSEPDPLQIIHQLDRFAVPLVDITDLPVSGRRFEAVTICNKEAHRGFDLAKGPLFRWLLIRLDEQEHVLVFTIHHIISDGWSMGIIVSDLMRLYSDMVKGHPVSLTPLTYEYADYSMAQTEWMNSQACHAQISYWKDKFKDIPEPLELPTDFPRPAIQSHRGASRTIFLDAGVCAKLRNMGSKENASFFMVLMAGFKTLLHRYTSAGDICVGTFVANRNRYEIENIVGFFVNTVAIRTKLHDDPTFTTLIQRVRDNALGAFANQDAPFENVLEEVKPERSLSRTPLFQVMMTLQNMPIPDLELPNLECEPMELDTFRSNFDLTLWMYEIGDTLKMVLEYSSDLFNESTISRILEHFKNLLHQVCSGPDRKISEMEFLGAHEREKLLSEWSGQRLKAEFNGKTVVEIFEERARTFPDNVALFDPHGNSGLPLELSYRDLNSKSNRFARALINQGIGPETCVALFTEPSGFMVIGIMGILKSGAAYTPLDSKYPEKRIEFILGDTQAPVVLTDKVNEQRLRDILTNSELAVKPHIVCVDRDWSEIESFSGEDISEKPGKADPAYLIYTSGSTGNPKGVIIEHSALAVFTESASKLYDITCSDRMQQFSSPSFDASVEEIFCALCSGASLALRSSTALKAMSELVAEWSDHKITILDLPTAFWHQLTVAMEENSLRLPKTLKTVIIGGEQPSVERLRAWRTWANPGIRLINTYGPTEATVVATFSDLTRYSDIDSGFPQIPIGRPLDHVKTYVLDENLKPTPIGVPGELCIGGKAIARGYVNLPEKTRDRFVTDPYGDTTGDRIYRTGDRARYRADGQLEFCGRIDRQVKIRGFRVELEEIDSALKTMPNVFEAYTMATKCDSRSAQIKAYVVLQQGSHVEHSDIVEYLKVKLPDFMIPSAFMILDKFPLTSGGKVDVDALKNIDAAECLEPVSPGLPRTPIEEVLLNIWRDVFRSDRIGVNDNFFHLGGHSLMSIEIIDRVNRAGLRLTVAEFIQNPTIEGQAKVVSIAKPSSEIGTWQCLVELQPRGVRRPLYLIHSNPGDVLGYVNLVNRLGYDQPCYGFESLGLKEPSKAHMTIEDMAAQYINEMTSFQPHPPYYLAGWCYGGLVAGEMAYQLQEMGKEVGLLALIETPFPRMTGFNASYYFKKLEGLIKLGPGGWMFYLQNKIQYLKKVHSGNIESAFSLDYDSGALSNRPQVYKLNTDAIKHYHLRGLISCPIRIFVGDIVEEGFIPDMEDLWSKMSKNVERHVVPGSHLTILKEPGANLLAKQLRKCLDQTSPSNGARG